MRGFMNRNLLRLNRKGWNFMEIKQFGIGDVLEMKKQHPCGEKRMKVMRVGSDIRILCLGCGRDVTVAREKLEKNIRKVISANETAVKNDKK